VSQARVSVTESRLPYRAIAALSLCNAAHFYSLCSIFSYAAFLCVDAGWVEHIDESGYMAGLLPTAVMSGRILTSFAWGIVSDKIGPRAVLSLSMLAVAAGNLLFGFSTPLWAALTVRFVVLGAGNGWIAILGPLSQELGGAERQSEVLALVFASGALDPESSAWLLRPRPRTRNRSPPPPPTPTRSGGLDARSRARRDPLRRARLPLPRPRALARRCRLCLDRLRCCAPLAAAPQASRPSRR